VTALDVLPGDCCSERALRGAGVGWLCEIHRRQRSLACHESTSPVGIAREQPSDGSGLCSGSLGQLGRPSVLSPGTGCPMSRRPSGEQAIELSGLEIQVKVSGLLAETTQTMRFYNPNDRVLEGNLSFSVTR